MGKATTSDEFPTMYRYVVIGMILSEHPLPTPAIPIPEGYGPEEDCPIPIYNPENEFVFEGHTYGLLEAVTGITPRPANVRVCDASDVLLNLRWL